VRAAAPSAQEGESVMPVSFAFSVPNLQRCNPIEQGYVLAIPSHGLGIHPHDDATNGALAKALQDGVDRQLQPSPSQPNTAFIIKSYNQTITEGRRFVGVAVLIELMLNGKFYLVRCTESGNTGGNLEFTPSKVIEASAALTTKMMYGQEVPKPKVPPRSVVPDVTLASCRSISPGVMANPGGAFDTGFYAAIDSDTDDDPTGYYEDLDFPEATGSSSSGPIKVKAELHTAYLRKI
jgi:hypothetical protein